jgi:hypothetical protein
LKREFMIDRQGKTFVLYAGLLDEAHQNGLKAIRTRLLQPPTAENGDTTICLAEIEMQDGRIFSGIGDANPQNVGRNIAAHAIRMAETRAKARALRDAVNVGTVALEELGDEESDAPPRSSVNRPENQLHEAVPPANRGASAASTQPTPITGRVARSQAAVRPNVVSEVADLATPAQLRAIYLIGRDQRGLNEQAVDERARGAFGANTRELTRRQASSFIDQLKAEATPAAS